MIDLFKKKKDISRQPTPFLILSRRRAFSPIFPEHTYYRLFHHKS